MREANMAVRDRDSEGLACGDTVELVQLVRSFIDQTQSVERFHAEIFIDSPSEMKVQTALGAPEWRWIIVQLLRNCDRAVPESGPILIGLRDYRNVVVLTVLDHGSGIEEALCRRLHEPISAFDPPEHRSSLLQIKERITKMGGAFQIASQIGRGTVVSVHVPKLELRT